MGGYRFDVNCLKINATLLERHSIELYMYLTNKPELIALTSLNLLLDCAEY